MGGAGAAADRWRVSVSSRIKYIMGCRMSTENEVKGSYKIKHWKSDEILPFCDWLRCKICIFWPVLRGCGSKLKCIFCIKGIWESGQKPQRLLSTSGATAGGSDAHRVVRPKRITGAAAAQHVSGRIPVAPLLWSNDMEKRCPSFIDTPLPFWVPEVTFATQGVSGRRFCKKTKTTTTPPPPPTTFFNQFYSDS